MTSPAVWGPSTDSSRLEVQLHWRLCRRSWSASDWREAYECQPRAVVLDGRRWPGSSRQLGSCMGAWPDSAWWTGVVTLNWTRCHTVHQQYSTLLYISAWPRKSRIPTDSRGTRSNEYQTLLIHIKHAKTISVGEMRFITFEAESVATDRLKR